MEIKLSGPSKCHGGVTFQKNFNESVLRTYKKFLPLESMCSSNEKLIFIYPLKKLILELF